MDKQQKLALAQRVIDARRAYDDSREFGSGPNWDAMRLVEREFNQAVPSDEEGYRLLEQLGYFDEPEEQPQSDRPAGRATRKQQCSCAT